MEKGELPLNQILQGDCAQVMDRRPTNIQRRINQ